MSTFYDLTIENSKNEKLQKYRIILSAYLLFTKMIAPFKYFQVPLAKAILFYKVPNYLQAQNNILSHLMGWLSWIKFIWKWSSHLLGWLGMVKVGCLGSIWSEIFLRMKAFFQAVPLTSCPTYVTSLLHIISW